MTIIRCIGRLATLIAALAVAGPAPAHPGPVHVHPCGADGRGTERTHRLPSGVVMVVRTTACRPVRDGRTTGVHVEVVR